MTNMLTQDNRNKLVQLVRTDTGEDANFYMLQIIGQVGLNELDNARKVTSLLDGVLQQIEMLNDVLETGEEFRRQVYNPNNGENEELGGMADDDGYVTINTQNAPMLIEQSLWSLVTLVAFAKMKDLEVTSQATSINEVDSSADVVAQKYTSDVLEAMGLEPRQQEPQASQEEPEEEPRQEEPEEEPEPTENPGLSNEEEISKPRLEMSDTVFKSMMSKTKKLGTDIILDHLKTMYKLDVMNAKTEVDARKIPSANSLIEFAQRNSILVRQLNKNIAEYEDLKYMATLVKIVLEAITLTQNTGLSEVSIFPEFYYETTGTNTVRTFQNAQRTLSTLIFAAHAINKSNQLVNELNLRVSNQEINMIYRNTLDLLVDYVDSESPVSNDKDSQLDKVDRAVDNLDLFQNMNKIREDMSRQMLTRIKIRKFASQEKVINANESASIQNVTMRGF